MKPTLITRKPVVELSNLDLRTFPIWEFASDEEGMEGRDETWVKPVAGTTIPLNSYSQIVAATFRSAASSTALDGFMVVTTVKQVVFQGNSIDLEDVELGAIINETGLHHHIPILDATGLLPLHYQLRVKVEGESSVRSGTIE